MLNAFFICVPRILWVLFAYPALVSGTAAEDYVLLLWCYPISWTLSAVAQVISYVYYRKAEAKRFAEEALPAT